MQIKLSRLHCDTFFNRIGFTVGVFLMLAPRIGLGHESKQSACSRFFERIQAIARANGNAPEQTRAEALALDEMAERNISRQRGQPSPVVQSENILNQLTGRVQAQQTGEFETGSFFRMTTGNGTRQRHVTEVSVLANGRIQFRDLEEGILVTSLSRITELHRIERPTSTTPQNATGRFLRSYPPPSAVDTVEGARYRNQAEIPFIGDAQIREVHQPPQEATLSSSNPRYASVQIGVNEFGRAIIQQQALRGCTAAAAAMLIYDNHRPVDLYDLVNSNLGTESTMANMIERAGLRPVRTTIPISMSRLRDLIAQNGPAIVAVGGELGGHVIVVDAIDYDAQTARIRDPYHGWDISIELNALRRRMFPSNSIVQVDRAR